MLVGLGVQGLQLKESCSRDSAVVLGIKAFSSGTLGSWDSSEGWGVLGSKVRVLQFRAHRF